MELRSLATLSLRVWRYAFQRLHTAVRCSFAVVRAAGFCGTILLPFAVSGSLLTGVATSDPGLFSMLLFLNILCIVLGRNYSPPGRE